MNEANENVAPAANVNETDKIEKKRRKRTVKEKKPRDLLRSKVVIRRLPPNLPEDIFKKTVAKWLDFVDWSSYYPGKIAQSKAKENRFSRAYLNFTSADALLEFYQNYSGHVFLDSQGNENRAVVELAQCQKTPKPKKKVDSRMNTIDQDPDYLAFVESLKNPPAADVAKPAETNENSVEKLERKLMTQQQQHIQQQYLDALGSSVSNNSTPLLDDLRAKKAAQKASIEQKKQLKAAKRERAKSANVSSAPLVKEVKSQKTSAKEEKEGKGAKVQKGALDKLKNEISKTLDEPKESKKGGKSKEEGKNKNVSPRSTEQSTESWDASNSRKPDQDSSNHSNAGDDGRNQIGRGPSRGGRKGKGAGNQKSAQSQQGPRVMIMKRDGTTTTFTAGDEGK
ncbi:hypothetical protein HK098_007650 [Nowakowskiella sp. JEL0407]|nr:hypothetical protein HK098_007650 [Nowakowskiella sp. JEL0407]